MTADELVDQLQGWAIDAATKRSDRPWCLFGLEGTIDRDALAKLFDRTDLFKLYSDRFDETDPNKKKPHSFLQVECHLLYGIHKAMTARHRTRLQAYRDDSSQKAFHVRRTVDKAYSRFKLLRDKSEGEAVGEE